MLTMKRVLVATILVFISNFSFGATFYAQGNGPWSNSAIWASDQAGSDTGTVGIPGVGDDVYTNGFIVGVTDVRTCRNIFVDDVTANGLFVASTLTVTGTMIGHSRNLFGFLGPSPNNPSTTVVAGGGSIVFTGVDVNTNGGATSSNEVIGYWSSTVTIPNVTLNFGSSNTRIFAVSNGTDDIVIGNLTISSGTLSCNQSSVTGLQITGTLDVDGAANVNVPFKGGSANTTLIPTVDISGIVVVNSGAYLNSNTFSITSGGEITVDNNEPNGWWYQTSSPGSINLNANSTVTYSTGSAQNIPARTYGNLSISSGGSTITKTLSSSGSLTVQGDLTIGSSTTFSTSSNSNNINLQGDVTNDGVLSITRPVVFSGGAHLIDGSSDIEFISSVSISASNTMDFNVNATFGGNLTDNNNNISYGGDFTFNGTTYNQGSGTITFDGSSQQIAGSGDINFVNLNLSGTTLSINATNASLSGLLSASGGSIDFDGSGSGSFTLVSNASGTASVGNLSTTTVSGNVHYERFFDGTGDVWRNFGIPVSGATVSDITGSGFTINGNDLAYYDESETALGTVDDGWVLQSTFGSNLSNTRGYSMWTRTEQMERTVTFTGALNRGNQNLTVSRTSGPIGPSDDGWNLVNNPYASTIDWDLVTSSNLDPFAYIWDGSNYQTVGSGGDISSGYIASGQSFYVHSSSGSPSLTVQEADKVSASTAFLRVTEETFENRLVVTMEGEGAYDKTYIWFRPDASPDFNSQYDALKLSNARFNLSSMASSGESLAINSLGSLNEFEGMVALNITNVEEGNYTLQFEEISSFPNYDKVILIDNYLSASTELIEGETYNFSVTTDEASWGDLRFEIQFVSTITGIENDLDEVNIDIYPNPVTNILHIEPGTTNILSVALYDISGAIIFESNKKLPKQIDMTGLRKGIYIINIVTEDEIINYRVKKK